MRPPSENPPTYTRRRSIGTSDSTCAITVAMNARSSTFPRDASPQHAPAFQSVGNNPNPPLLPSGYTTTNPCVSASASNPDVPRMTEPLPGRPGSSTTSGSAAPPAVPIDAGTWRRYVRVWPPMTTPWVVVPVCNVLAPMSRMPDEASPSQPSANGNNGAIDRKSVV